MMDRRSFLCGLTLGTLAAPLTAEAQQAEEVWRVGFLEAGSSSVNRHFLDAFRQGLSEFYSSARPRAWPARQYRIEGKYAPVGSL